MWIWITCNLNTAFLFTVNYLTTWNILIECLYWFDLFEVFLDCNGPCSHFLFHLHELEPFTTPLKNTLKDTFTNYLHLAPLNWVNMDQSKQEMYLWRDLPPPPLLFFYSTRLHIYIVFCLPFEAVQPHSWVTLFSLSTQACPSYGSFLSVPSQLLSRKPKGNVPKPTSGDIRWICFYCTTYFSPPPWIATRICAHSKSDVCVLRTFV